MALEIVRVETAEDLDEVRELMLEYVEHMAANLPHLDRDAFAEELRALPCGYRAIVSARSDGVPAGCVMLRDGALPRSGEIRRLYVRPAARRGGVARALLGRLMAEARELGYERMELVAVVTYAGAAELYESLGFRAVEPFRPSTTPYELLLFMEREL